MDRTILEKVATEMNTVMELDPPISVAGTDEELEKMVLDEATGHGDPTQGLRVTDFSNPENPAAVFSKEVADFFAQVGLWDKKHKRVRNKAKEVKNKPVIQPEPIQQDVQTPEPEPQKEVVISQEKEKKADKPQKPEKKKKEKETTETMATKAAVKKGTAKKVTKTKSKARQNAIEKAKVKKPAASTDAFGFRAGSKTSQAIAYLNGRTMGDAKKKFGATFYEALNKIRSNGHTVKIADDKTITVTAKSVKK